MVTNSDWQHFWLNEGWTTYLERRIQAYVHGEKFRDFSAIIGWKAFTDAVNQFGTDHEFTKLVTNLKNVDPDDCFSTIPYEKGFTFLYSLEKLIGKEKWDKFIPHVSTGTLWCRPTTSDVFDSTSQPGNFVLLTHTTSKLPS